MGKHNSGQTSNPKDGYTGKHSTDRAAGTAAQRKALEEQLRQQGKVK